MLMENNAGKVKSIVKLIESFDIWVDGCNLEKKPSINKLV